MAAGSSAQSTIQTQSGVGGRGRRVAEDRLSPVLASVALAKADIPHRMISKQHTGPSHSNPGAARRLPFRTFGPRPF